jgi:hypothetical protein
LCRQGEDFATQQYPVDKGREYAVRTSVDEAGNLQFVVSENSSATAPDFGPITNFRFYLFSDPERDFHVAVDDIWITYN